jgi:hypothetical protein
VQANCFRSCEPTYLGMHGLHPRSLLDALLWLDSGDDEARSSLLRSRVSGSKNLQTQEILFRYSQGSDRHLEVYILRWTWFRLMHVENDSGLQFQQIHPRPCQARKMSIITGGILTAPVCGVVLASLLFCRYMKHQKGIYVDGHERPDVAEYR